jgi:hypothetical protein
MFLSVVLQIKDNLNEGLNNVKNKIASLKHVNQQISFMFEMDTSTGQILQQCVSRIWAIC